MEAHLYQPPPWGEAANSYGTENTTELPVAYSLPEGAPAHKWTGGDGGLSRVTILNSRLNKFLRRNRTRVFGSVLATCRCRDGLPTRLRRIGAGTQPLH